MWEPKFTITPKLLDNVRRVYSLVTELNQKRYSKVVLVEMEKAAREMSAYASTSIEGNPLPLTEVKHLLKSAPRFVRDTEREVLNYNRALESLSDGVHELNMELVLGVHRMVMERLLPEGRVGKLRVDPVFVNDPRTGQAVYLPPDAKDVDVLIDSLIEYIGEYRDKMEPLILAGVFHKQLVIIHPFMDGNGRTTRLLTKVILAKMGLNTFNLFSFENYYNRNVSKYFSFVGERGNYYELEIDFTAWLEYFTDGIIDELLRVGKELNLVSVGPERELAPYHKAILRFIEEKGYIADRDYAKLTARAKATRALDFGKLMEMGLIERVGKGRKTYYRMKR